MIEYLREIYKDPNKAENVRRIFGNLFIKKDQTFVEFYINFLYIVSEAKVD